MARIYKKTVNYRDFHGRKKSADLYFNLTVTDTIRMAMKETQIDYQGEEETDNVEERMSNSQVVDGLSKRIGDTFRRGKGKELLAVFDEMVALSYGEIDEDGESFRKSPEIYEKWTHTASYDAFFQGLMYSNAEMQAFFNAVFPSKKDLEEYEKMNDWKKDENEDREFARHREELASRQNPAL